MINEKISDTFQHYYPPNDDQSRVAEDLRERFTLLEAFIIRHTPPGRRQRLALDALEDSAMWAIKATSHDWTKP